MRIRVGARLAALSLAALSLAALAAGCGGGTAASSSNTVSNGQLNIQLPGGSGSNGSSGSTVPLAKASPLTGLLGALTSFQSCLQGLNVTFIGAPDPSNPNSPANDPTYIKNLTTCAAKSQILQALKSAQSWQDRLKPAQITILNKGYLKWRDCMIGRGWTIPTPQPDEKGRLFSFGTPSGTGSGTSTPAFTPPPGQTLLSSSDFQACASKAAKEVPGASAIG